MASSCSLFDASSPRRPLAAPCFCFVFLVGCVRMLRSCILYIGCSVWRSSLVPGGGGGGWGGGGGGSVACACVRVNPVNPSVCVILTLIYVKCHDR